jgi:hypothetical protein
MMIALQLLSKVILNASLSLSEIILSSSLLLVDHCKQHLNPTLHQLHFDYTSFFEQQRRKEVKLANTALTDICGTKEALSATSIIHKLIALANQITFDYHFIIIENDQTDGMHKALIQQV